MRTLISLIIISSFHFSVAQEAEAPSYFLCKHDKVVRSIQVKLNHENKCAVIYSKEGESKQVGASAHVSLCEEIALKIKKNLESSSWDCRDVKNFKSSNLNSGEEK